MLKRASLVAAAGSVILAAAVPAGAVAPASYRTVPSAMSGDFALFFFPGGTDIGSNCDDCTTPIAPPFPITFYGQSSTAALAGAL